MRPVKLMVYITESNIRIARNYLIASSSRSRSSSSNSSCGVTESLFFLGWGVGWGVGVGGRSSSGGGGELEKGIAMIFPHNMYCTQSKVKWG